MIEFNAAMGTYFEEASTWRSEGFVGGCRSDFHLWIIRPPQMVHGLSLTVDILSGPQMIIGEAHTSHADFLMRM